MKMTPEKKSEFRSYPVAVCWIKENKYQCIGWLMSCIIFFSLYIYYIRTASPLVPYMDTVRYIGQVHDLLTGDISLSDIWHQHGSVGVFYQFITLIEWIFWGVDTTVTVNFTAFVWLMSFLFYVKAWPNYYNEKIDAKLNKRILARVLFTPLLVGFYFFSPAGWEIYLLDLGFAQELKNLFIIAFLYFLSRIDFQTCDTSKLIFYGICGSCIILFTAYGWSYPFTVTVIFLVVLCKGVGAINNRGLYVIIPILIGQVIYIKESAGVVLTSMAVTHDIGGAVDFFKGVLYGSATVFVGSETLHNMRLPTYITMGIGLLFLIVLLFSLMCFFKNKKVDRNGSFFAALMFFGFCTLIVISLARGGQGYEFVGAPRYFMDYQFMFIGFVAVSTCLLALPQRKVIGVSITRFELNKTLFIFFLCLFSLITVVGQTFTYLDEYKKAPYRAALYKAQSLVYLSGEINEINSKLLQTNIDTLFKASAIADRYSLVSLRKFSGKCNLSSALTTGNIYGMESTGRWLGASGKLIIGDCPQTFRLEGFLPKKFTKRTLMLDVNGEIHKILLVPGEPFSVALNNREPQHIVRLAFSIEHTVPKSEISSIDKRDLGVFITKIII
jgi:hypothetical protein